MKKLALTLCLAIAATSASYAFYLENDTHEIDTLRAQGFSESTIQVVDTATTHNKGKNARNRTHYVYKGGDNPIGRSYSRIKWYFDPAQDDGRFGSHQINISNTWGDGTPKYQQMYSSDYSSENL